MCSTCGCGDGESTIDGAAMHHHHNHDHAHHHDQPQHHHPSSHGHDHAHDHSAGRMVRVEQDLLAKNQRYADINRQRFADLGVCALNLVSSPGSGKTTLLCETIRRLPPQSVLVVEGDQQTDQDAARIRATGAPAVQINTGKGCHLDAHMVGHALQALPMQEGALLLIENVGNLVCPASFDLGEAAKVVVLSVTEGEDKPIKYPDMFRAASVMLLNKMDLLPYVQFNVDAAIAYARRVNPGIEVLQVSATRGDGMDAWLEYLQAGMARAATQRQQTLTGLRSKVAELEARLQAK